MTPILFQCPVFLGKIKRRVAKKYLNRWGIGFFLSKERYAEVSHLGVGDYVNDCSGFNGKILSVSPEYRRVSKGEVLIDIDLQTENTGCSITSCGVQPALTQEQVNSGTLKFLEEWFFGEGGKTWFGGLDNPKYKTEIDLATKKLKHLKSGGSITDDHGVLLPEWKKHYEK